jgi:hypothetical protein
MARRKFWKHYCRRTFLVTFSVYVINVINGEKRNAYRVLVGKPEGKRPLGRPKRRWVDNIRMDLGEVGWDNVTGLVWLSLGTGGELL